MYFPLIDLLRFIAAVAVMCFHYFPASAQGNSGPLDLFIRYGFLGVQLFFIISGFVIYFSLKKPAKEYALSRFLRLYPLFWGICTFTYILTLILPNGQPLPFIYYLQNLLIVNNGNVLKMVDGSYWTLTMEILFYFYIGLFAYWVGLKKLEWFYAGWLLLSFLSFYFGAYNLFILKVLLTRYAPYFVFGGVLGLAFEKWPQATNAARARYLALLVFSALLPMYISHVLKLATGPVTDLFGIYDGRGLVITESFFVIVPLAAYLSLYATRKILVKTAKIAGGITYPLYLLHQKIGSMVISLHAAYGKFNAGSLATAIGMVLAAYVVYIYEAKVRKKLHSFIDAKWPDGDPP